ncbi:uncharacterized protein BJ212DRAFT_1361725 [Suillus subaureus]|uniref:ER transporter 6TM N-terminal domain-containing protein n=1 Tax=Suillus subaureus TaxID=48587 RepID=A0A9P7E9G3_9AGAM|nr:uncharacterized protein BJ212DRAFT_1361725 [Suillus subaureus]KAG1814722.1 hypothetical protein BJ212DRAFT_1361725 [Suillus subaureus]
MTTSRPQVRIQTDPTGTFNKSNSIIEAEGNQRLPSQGRSNGDQDERAASEIEKNTDVSESSDHTDEKQPVRQKIKLPQSLQWIPANSTWSKWKPVIRSALTAWIAVVVFIIPRTENLLGQAAFLIIIASFLSPPSDPFMAVLEREIFMLIFVALGWAWVCLGLMFASLARTQTVPDASILTIITGEYIEAWPTVIMGVFLFIGSFFFLYIKARLGPGPFLPASVFGCICVDISLTSAVLFPYPYYKIGQTIMLPLVFHSAISLAMSILVFPQSVSTLFVTRLQGVLAPLATAISLHRSHLLEDVTSSAFSHTQITDATNKAENALPMLAVAARLLRVDIVYARFAPTDYNELHTIMRKLMVRVHGMGVYYTLIDPTRERFPVTPVASRPATPVRSRPPSPRPDRRSSMTTEEKHAPSADHELRDRKPSRHQRALSSRVRSHPASSTSPLHSYRPHQHSHSHHAHHTHLHSSLLHLALSRAPKRSETAVGVFESQKYLNLEAIHLSHPDSVFFTARATELLSNSCQDLLSVCEEVLGISGAWIGNAGKFNFDFLRGHHEDKAQIHEKEVQKYEDLLEKLTRELDEFRTKKRLTVLDPYRPMFDHSYDTSSDDEVPPHRFLFHCYVYQYHLLHFAVVVQDMLKEIIRLETERKKPRLWLPSLPKLFTWTTWEPSGNIERDDDEDPEIIPGMNPAWMTDLGKAVKRDPDALPPRNALEIAMNWIYRAAIGIGGGNVLFALKAGALTVILSIPSFLKTSAQFAYANKFVWAVFMGQLTLARFRGDTTFGLVARLISTFTGGLLGTVMWYISTGSGRGSPYGLAAVCAVCYPSFFFARLYWPIPPMTNLIIWVTAALVIGYSYEDTHLTVPSSPGWGIDVAWRRFVLVSVGVLAAGIFSLFPPSRTIRSYQRRTLATTSAELGSIYCSVVSYANSHVDKDNSNIVQSLLAIRSKLKRSLVMKENVIYEFSLRGKWPAERYHKILEIQMQIAYQLCHLMSTVHDLEPAWAHAFLRRTRMLDSDFQGDVLAVISLISNALRTGSPLPQITPCPLLDRFMVRHHGLNVVHEESEDNYGLPRMLTVETLENLQYLTFCVGVSTTFGIITRLDRLMVAVKELVGEQYHIDGVGMGHHRTWTGGEVVSPTMSVRTTDV